MDTYLSSLFNQPLHLVQATLFATGVSVPLLLLSGSLGNSKPMAQRVGLSIVLAMWVGYLLNLAAGLFDSLPKG